MEPFEGAHERLLEHTIDSIKKKFHRRMIVATDTEWAKKYVRDMRVKAMEVSDGVSETEGSYKDLLLDVGSKMNMDPDDEFVTLSLEYPSRTYRNIRSAIQFYRKHPDAKSLLCRKEATDRPEKIFFEREGDRGEPVMEDAGQEWLDADRPEIYKHSHFVTIHEVSELPKVNDWLWNDDTIFFPINGVRRTVTPEELSEYETDE
jgi:hypothetical protein